MSVLTKEPPQGRKYSVNALITDGTALDCAARPLWTQILAAAFLFAFEECNPTNQANPRQDLCRTRRQGRRPAGADRARPGADRQLSAATDLVTVLIGANDVIDLYENVLPGQPHVADSRPSSHQRIDARAAPCSASAINAFTALGPKVILSTIPLMNLTPYALRQRRGD